MGTAGLAGRWGKAGLVLVLLGLALFLVFRLDDEGRRAEAPRASRAGGGEPELREPEPLAPAAPAERAAAPRLEVAPAAEADEPETGDVMRLLVVDDRELSLSGASVVATEDGTVFETSTDEEGRCAVPLSASAAKPRAVLHLLVEKEGHFHVNRAYFVEAELTLVLPREATLNGLVLERDGDAAIGGARVSLVHARCKGCSPEVVEADAAGRFALAGVPVGSPAVFLVQAAGYGDLREELTVSSADGGRRNFRLARAASVRGRVVDAVTGLPVGGAQLQLDGPTTEADGTFVLELVLDELGYVDVGARDYCHTYGRPDPAELRRGEPLAVPLLPAAFVRGTVTDAAGEPVGGAVVSFRENHRRMAQEGRLAARKEQLAALPLSGWNVQNELVSERTTTDERGAFSSPGLVPWTTYTVRAGAEGFEWTGVDVELPGGPGSFGSVEVVLAAGPEPLAETGSLRGVLTFNGEPVRGELKWSSADRSGRTSVGLDGRFLAEGLPPGAVDIDAQPEPRSLPWIDGLESRQSPAVVQVTAGTVTVQDVAVELPVAPIAGIVRTTSGVPLAEVGLTAVEKTLGLFVHAESDEAGRFRFDTPSELRGPYLVRANRASVLVIEDDVPPGTEDLVLVFPELGKLRIRVIDESGDPVPDYRIWLRRPGTALTLVAPKRSRAPDVDGWFEIETAVGPQELLAGRGKVATVLEPTHVDAGRTSSVELRLRATGRLTLRCAPEALPLARAAGLVLTPAEHLGEVERGERGQGPRSSLIGVLAHRVVFDETGSAELPPLGEGRYVLCSGSENLVVEPAELRVSGGESSTVELRLRERD